MSLSWSVPLKHSSCSWPAHWHSMVLYPAVAALRGLKLADRGWFIFQKESILTLKVPRSFDFYILERQLYKNTWSNGHFVLRSRCVTALLLSLLGAHIQTCLSQPVFHPVKISLSWLKGEGREMVTASNVGATQLQFNFRQYENQSLPYM